MTVAVVMAVAVEVAVEVTVELTVSVAVEVTVTVIPVAVFATPEAVVIVAATKLQTHLV